MVCDFKCGVIGRPNRFMTSNEMRFFWLPLLAMNCNREPFTQICELKKHSPSSGSSGSIFWTLVVVMMVLGSIMIICFPLSIPFLGFDLDLEHAYDFEAFSLASNDCLAQQSFCCEWGSCGIHTTFLCLTLSSWCYYFLVAFMGCAGSPNLGYVLCYAVWGFLFLVSDLKIQSLTSSI